MQDIAQRHPQCCAQLAMVLKLQMALLGFHGFEEPHEGVEQKEK